MDQINRVIAGMTQAPSQAGPNPNNPFAAAPIPLSELMLRAAGTILPPPGQMRVPAGAKGAVLGGALRIGAGMANILGQEMALIDWTRCSGSSAWHSGRRSKKPWLEAACLPVSPTIHGLSLEQWRRARAWHQ
jgi:hypothetical protein